MPREITAAVFTAESAEGCSLMPALLADPGPRELVIEVKACGICHTDIGFSSYMPRPSVLGHETSGVIVEMGAHVTGFSVGQRVTATFSACMQCETCVDEGRPAYCIDHAGRNFDGVRPNGQPSLTMMDGTPLYSAFFQQSGFATHALVQMDNIVPIPPGLGFIEAAPLGCGIQTGAGAVLNSFGAKAGQSIVIFGVGAVGMSAVMAARHSGCETIIAVDRDGPRVARARSRGATHVFNSAGDDFVDQVKALTAGGAHYALEGTGNPDLFQKAILCLRPAGMCGVLTSVGGFGDTVAHPGGMALMNTTMVGIIEGDSVPATFIPQLADMHAAGALPYDDLIETFAFADINQALAAGRSGAAVKPVLVMDG